MTGTAKPMLLARDPLNGTRIALALGVGFALAGAVLSALRLSPKGSQGGQAVRVLEARMLLPHEVKALRDAAASAAAGGAGRG